MRSRLNALTSFGLDRAKAETGVLIVPEENKIHLAERTVRT